MDKENAVLTHDLMILEEMAANMAAYLDSDVVDWMIPRVNMPRLTIGGYLMRQKRLAVLRNKLPADGQARLDTAVTQFDEALQERVVRFEKHAHQELHMRIAEWIGILPDLNRRANMEVNYYSGVVDTRIVIKELLEILQSPPYELEEGVVDEIDAIDRLLKTRLNEQAFVWDPIWETAYPREVYWWMYGSPRLI